MKHLPTPTMGRLVVCGLLILAISGTAFAKRTKADLKAALELADLVLVGEVVRVGKSYGPQPAIHPPPPPRLVGYIITVKVEEVLKGDREIGGPQELVTLPKGSLNRLPAERERKVFFLKKQELRPRRKTLKEHSFWSVNSIRTIKRLLQRS